ncbi:heme-binding domain-containing protein [Chryseobacterium limigenitum]|uniref:Haem-binding domain-containing protein n=1 Tax=Chryseobacterium limigenitum TaxID=1612149 RepID=A0A1K2IJC1_9FLAO|nr:heme-binding domain-containing protein [Chryseobacterium limigenitum]SFZ92370.1 Haem-binding domain-containing protein [Chryseobacterium limigenitum]
MNKSIFNLKNILTILLLLFIGIQFIDVKKNISQSRSANAIENYYTIPVKVQTILKTSCYDCHSNNTSYPWYSNVQPVKWWLADHVDSGKRHLNFDEFNTYSRDKKLEKLDEIIETIKEGEMPLTSYTAIHQKAKLSMSDQSEIEKWVNETKRDVK